ncbi:MAG: Holliday junction resolvase RuvX [Arcobacteraceae bacterium]|nr:Holliday junction resolvase RuvX [Arcobacteraceae bacterium]
MKLCAIDVGLKRIGVATSVYADIVTPQEPILRKNRDQAANDVDKFLSDNGIDKLIVGYPTSSLDMQNRIKHFVGLLKFDGDKVFVEEDMSSIEAEEQTKGIIKHKRDGKIDSIAASIILKRYLGCL